MQTNKLTDDKEPAAQQAADQAAREADPAYWKAQAQFWRQRFLTQVEVTNEVCRQRDALRAAKSPAV